MHAILKIQNILVHIRSHLHQDQNPLHLIYMVKITQKMRSKYNIWKYTFYIIFTDIEKILIHHDLDVYTVISGSTYSFDCTEKEHSHSNIDVQWLFQNKPIVFTENSRFKKKNNNAIYMNKIVESDAGIYKCVTDRGLNSDTIATFKIIVKV